MDNVFLELLNMSITASWLVLAIIIFRGIFQKAPKYINVILWGLVGIRLICPFSIESAISLVPSVETVPENIVYEQTPAINSGVPIINSVINPIISDTLSPNVGNSVYPIQIVLFVASYIWLIGMVVMVLYTLISYLRIKGKVREAVPIGEKVWICDHIDTPFILGVIRPIIYLPSSLCEEDMKYVLAHEQAHVKRHDHWWKPLGFVLLAIYWFNPLLWVAYVLLCRDIELACDEKVLKEMGIEIKKSYSEALINCSVPRKVIAACPLAFGEVGVKERVKTVLNYKKPAFWVIVIAVVTSLIVGVCFLTNPKEENKHSVKMQICKGNEHFAVFEDECYFYAWDANRNLYRVMWDDFRLISEGETVLVEFDEVKVFSVDADIMGGWQPRYEVIAKKVTPLWFDNLKVFDESVSNSSHQMEWFDHWLRNDYDGNDVLEIELEELPGVTFRLENGTIIATDSEGKIRNIYENGLPIAFQNGYFCDLTSDGIPELCGTVSVGSGWIDERIVVYDYIADEVYELENRSNYSFILSLVGDELVVSKTDVIDIDNVLGQGNLVLKRDVFTGKYHIEFVEEKVVENSYSLESGMYLAGVDKDMYDVTSSTAFWPYFYLNTEKKEFRMSESIAMSSAIFGTYEFDGLTLTLSVNDESGGDVYVLHRNQYGSFVYDEEASTLVSEVQWLKKGMAFGLRSEE